jgi:hypothetical protein
MPFAGSRRDFLSPTQSRGLYRCFEYDANDPSYCREPANLDSDGTKPNGVQLHHVVRRRTQTSCNWGKNAMENGVLISKQLNTYFSNSYPGWLEISRVNQAPAY